MVEKLQREWLPVSEWRKRHQYRFGRGFVYEQARLGNLLSIRVSGKVLIAADALDELANRTPSRESD